MEKLDKLAPVLHQLASTIVNKNTVYNNSTLHQTARVIADTIGTAYSGVNTEAFRRAIRSRELLFGIGNVNIIGITETSSLAGAIFYSTLAISSTDFDEGHRKAVGHPASMIVPAAIILGEYLNASNENTLRSVIIGYEMATRFSNARIKEKITTYSSGRWGAIGTAATVSYLLGLSIDQTMHALSNAAILSPAMLGGSTDVSTGSMSKEGAAWAAQSGLQSSLLSKEEFVGPYLFVDDHDDYNKDVLLEGLGDTWLINSNYFKPYSCCRWLHSAISAAIEIKKENNLIINNIATIEVSIFKRAIHLIGNKHPQNTIQAQFHLPYCIAVGLLYDKVTPKEFSEMYLCNTNILNMINITFVRNDDEYSQLFPEKLPSKVIISTISGDQFMKEILSAPWDADNPPSDEDLKEKFLNQVGDKDNKQWEEIFDY